MLILLLFNSFDTQTVTITKVNPSLMNYTNLQILHEDTLKCPCSNARVTYNKFISISPIFHQVCSSDLVNKSWIAFLSYAVPVDQADSSSLLRNFFQLLSNICELVSRTITNAAQQFLAYELITSNVLNKRSFDAQLSTTITQFIQTLVDNFGPLVDTIFLFTHVDQPFKISDNRQTIDIDLENDLYDLEAWKVCNQLIRNLSFFSLIFGIVAECSIFLSISFV